VVNSFIILLQPGSFNRFKAREGILLLSFALELWFDSLVKGETALGAAGIWFAGLIAIAILAVFALIVFFLFRRRKAKEAAAAPE